MGNIKPVLIRLYTLKGIVYAGHREFCESLGITCEAPDRKFCKFTQVPPNSLTQETTIMQDLVTYFTSSRLNKFGSATNESY